MSQTFHKVKVSIARPEGVVSGYLPGDSIQVRTRLDQWQSGLITLAIHATINSNSNRVFLSKAAGLHSIVEFESEEIVNPHYIF